MRVSDYIRSKIRLGTLHMTLIDPDKLGPSECAEVAYLACRAGTDAIMVGGSTGIDFETLDRCVVAMKERIAIPIIQFPSHAKAISPNSDAIYFMSMLNSMDINFIIGEQMKAAKMIKEIGLETIPMGYVIVEPGMKVGETGSADPVKRDDNERAIGYALAAELLGMDLFYLEAGSGAPDPVSPEMVSEIVKFLSIPLVVGGGIRTEKAAREIAEAGASIVVTGTIVEESEDVEGILKRIISAVKG
jgi:phosphoglycerol geranylgeranyltransferase